MPRNATLVVPKQTWTILTDEDVSSLTFQVKVAKSKVKFAATTDTTAPATDAIAIEYDQGMGEANIALSDLFPGLSGAARIWAYSGLSAEVFVSHA